MDYTTLVGSKTTYGSIANWINHADAQNAAPAILDEAQSFIYRRLRHWRMVKKQAFPMVINQDFVLLSQFTNYLEDRYMKFNGIISNQLYTDEIERRDDTEVLAGYNFDAAGNRVAQSPSMFYIDDTNINFDSPADLAYPCLFLFYQQPAALSGSNLTNFITTYYPRMLRCACMAGAAEFMKDAGQGNYDRTYWENLASTEINTAQAESDMQERSNGSGFQMI